VDLVDIPAALAAIPEQDLYTLRATLEAAPNAVPGLLAYLDHAVGWEIDRRAGQSYALQGPMAAIPDEEVAASLDALAVLRNNWYCAFSRASRQPISRSPPRLQLSIRDANHREPISQGQARPPPNDDGFLASG